MSAENDPLLPKYPSAPEISGYGFSTPRRNNSEEVRYESNGDGSLSDGRDDGYGEPSLKTYGSYDDRGHKEGSGNGNWFDPNHASEGSDRSMRNTALSQIFGLFAFVVFVGFLLSALIPGGLRSDPSPLPIPDHKPLSIPERAVKILQHTPLFDGHNDLAIFLRAAYKNKIHSPEFRSKFESGGMEAHVDIPRLKKGLVGGAFWSAFVPCPVNASYDFSDKTYASAVSTTLSQIDILHSLQKQYPDIFIPATTPLNSALSTFHANHTIIGSLSIEGLHQIPPSAPMSTLRLYYALGVRAATLTWNCHNVAADAAIISDLDPSTGEPTMIVAPKTPRNGLSPVGRKIIREMNRLGMLVDLSHTSYWTQLAVLSNTTSLAPVIYSHSSSFALCPHPRNVHDSLLPLIRHTNSLVMINFSPDFISCTPPSSPSSIPPFYPPNSTLSHVLDHITHIGDAIGYAHVGLGSDFDGIDSTPRGLDDVSKFPALVEGLLERGVSDKDVERVVGGNLIRVWQEVERVKERMEREGVPEGEDEVGGIF